MADRPREAVDAGAARARRRPPRVAPEHLEAAQDDATILAIRDQERAGLDIITDGEQRRESYSNRFATALDGVDVERPGTTLSRTGKPIAVPRVVGPIRRLRPVGVRDLAVLRANTGGAVKATVPGPFTLSKQAQDDFYGDAEAMALDDAAALNAEIKDLFAAGADIVQIDEPWMQQHPADARRYGLKALDRALAGVTGTVAVHLCFGYAALVHDKPSGYSFLPELESSKAQQVSIEAAQPGLDCRILQTLPSKTIIVGVIDLADMKVETPATVAGRIRRALDFVVELYRQPRERLFRHPGVGRPGSWRHRPAAKLLQDAAGSAVSGLDRPRPARSASVWCATGRHERTSTVSRRTRQQQATDHRTASGAVLLATLAAPRAAIGTMPRSSPALSSARGGTGEASLDRGRDRIAGAGQALAGKWQPPGCCWRWRCADGHDGAHERRHSRVVPVKNRNNTMPASAAGSEAMMMKGSSQDWKSTTINR